MELERVPGKGGMAGTGEAPLAVVAVAVAGVGAAGSITEEIDRHGFRPVGSVEIRAVADDPPQGNGDHHQQKDQRDAFCGKRETHGKLLSSQFYCLDYR